MMAGEDASCQILPVQKKYVVLVEVLYRKVVNLLIQDVFFFIIVDPI